MQAVKANYPVHAALLAFTEQPDDSDCLKHCCCVSALVTLLLITFVVCCVFNIIHHSTFRNMSTHFHPRPASERQSSPVRPSTAHSTIRAVTPSPTVSLNEALRSDLAHLSSTGRPYSEIIPHIPATEPFATDVKTAETKVFDDTPVKAASPGLQHGGATPGRSSPAKLRSRSHSPMKKPYYPPTALDIHQESQELAHHHDPGHEQETDDTATVETKEHDCPDTPTPMTQAQKRQAYTPLGATPPTPSFLDEQAQSPAQRHPSIPHRASPPHVHSSERTYKPRPNILTAQAKSREYHDHSLPQPVPLHAGRHVSVSAQSNVSGGTVASRRSVFSTPGRDELERKKALVEVDEGPFARATSVKDLDRRRRRVSIVEGVEERGDWRKRGQGRSCGLRRGCAVM